MAVVLSFNSSDATSEKKGIFLPQFFQKASTIDRIEIANRATQITLFKKSGANFWYIKELDGFFADDEMIAKLLYDFSMLKVIDKKTKKSENYHHLSLQDISKDDSKAVQFSFYVGDDVLEKVLIGNQSFAQKDTLYARKSEQQQSFLLEGKVSKNVNKFQYKKSLFTPFDKDSIQKITFHKGQKTLEKGADNRWKISLVKRYKKRLKRS